MKLIEVKIRNYKHLKNIDCHIANDGEAWKAPVFFCIGLNGSGKSVFLEAIALIFSRISQDELPGFYFEIAYDIFIKGENVRVFVKPADRKDRQEGRLHIEIKDKVYPSFRGLSEYLPYKIIVCTSGKNSRLQEMIQDAARDSIISDIYDAEDYEEINGLLQYLKTLRENPRMLYLDEEMAALILFALCAWKPSAEEKAEDKYIELRSRLFRRLGKGIRVCALSLVGNNEMEGALIREFFQADMENGLADQVMQTENQKTAVFELKGERESFGHLKIAGEYFSPLQLLTVLLQARSRGELRECHFFFKTGQDSDMLNETALSDGELLWAARMGLILAAAQEQTANCLFLYDEPDVHMNESWNMEFISTIQEIRNGWEEKELYHNFWVATHSSLLLTDAPPGQVFQFEKKNGVAEMREVPVSLLAGDREKISDRMFQCRAEIGEYAKGKLREIQSEKNPESIREHIDQIGAGLERLKLWEIYCARKKDSRG